MPICFATNNPHKIEEVRAIAGNDLRFVGLNEIGCREELPEEERTIAGNSRQKAEYVFRNYHVTSFADDSGLEVEALNNAPGVDSAHYAGPQRNHNDNMALLIANLAGVDNRRAQFKTVITLVSATGSHQFEGTVPGTILHEKKGTGGFGYDPLFLPDGAQRTFAEMTMDEKNNLSHRARAIVKLVAFLKTHPFV
jgi:XTP/dITP diphosphohydrolase